MEYGNTCYCCYFFLHGQDIVFLMIIYTAAVYFLTCSCITPENPIHIFYKPLSLPFSILFAMGCLFLPQQKPVSVCYCL